MTTAARPVNEQSCHHIAPNRKNMVGLRFNRLLILSIAGKCNNRGLKYLCRCDCGQEKVISSEAIVKGQKSCGCINREKPTGIDSSGYVHGQTGTPTYRSWSNMVQRCVNPNNPKYKRYGGRGIKVCERWQQFRAFFADMGPCPVGFTIERIENNGNYEPSNCMWIEKPKQARNRSNNRVISFCGESKTLVEWSERLKIPHATLRTRLHRNWSILKAFSTPP